MFHTRILISLLGEKRSILSCTYSICNERIFLLAVVVKSVAVADVDDAVKFAGARKGRILLDTRVTQEREVKEIVRHNFPLFGGRVLLGFGPPSLGFLVNVLITVMDHETFFSYEFEHLRRVVVLHSLVLVVLFLQIVFISSQLSFVVLVRRRRGGCSARFSP